MLRCENKSSAKFLIMIFNGKIFCVVHHYVHTRVIESRNSGISRVDY